MIEIKGKYNTAVCYAKVVEEDAIDQIRHSVICSGNTWRITCMTWRSASASR